MIWCRWRCRRRRRHDDDDDEYDDDDRICPQIKPILFLLVISSFLLSWVVLLLSLLIHPIVVVIFLAKLVSSLDFALLLVSWTKLADMFVVCISCTMYIGISIISFDKNAFMIKMAWLTHSPTLPFIQPYYQRPTIAELIQQLQSKSQPGSGFRRVSIDKKTDAIEDRNGIKFVLIKCSTSKF